MVSKLKDYSTTPADNNATPPNGWPEGMNPSDVNNAAREMMARMREWYDDAGWLNHNDDDNVSGFTGSTLDITGDVTDRFTVNRIIRLDEDDAKIVTITGSVFAAGTTTVTVTGYTIVGTPTAIELSIIDADGDMLPASGVTAGATGAADTVPVVTVDAKGRITSITSAAIAIAQSAVSGLVSALAAKLNTADHTKAAHDALNIDADTVDGADTATAATASTLVLRDGNGRAKIATPSASGDIASKGYVDGARARVLLDSPYTASNDSEVDVALSGTYDRYVIEIDNLLPASSGVTLRARISDDEGVSFESGSGDYKWGFVSFDSSGETGVGGGQSGQTYAELSRSGGGDGVSNAADEGGYSGTITVYRPNDTTRSVNFRGEATYLNNFQEIVGMEIAFTSNADDEVTHVRFYFSTGNVTSGEIRVYGVTGG